MGKTSKKGWRNIKLTDEIATMTSKQDAADLESRVDTLFTLDSKGTNSGVAKKLLREVSLLNKSSKPAAAVSELPLVQKALKSAKHPIRKATNKNQLRDLWADDAPKKHLKPILPSSILRRESFAPAVIPTNAALSVNPDKSQLEQLIVETANKLTATKDAGDKATVSTAATPSTSNSIPLSSDSTQIKFLDGRKTKAQKLKEKAHKQLLKEHEIRRKEKELRRQEHDKAGRIAKQEALEQRQSKKLKTVAQRIVAEAAGKYTLPRGAGGRLLATEESVPTEIASSLRRIVPLGNPLLERRASLLKRRMIEQVPELTNEYKEKVRFARLDAKKAVKLLDKEARDRCVLLG
jgi:hypothetical protein